MSIEILVIVYAVDHEALIFIDADHASRSGVLLHRARRFDKLRAYVAIGRHFFGPETERGHERVMKQARAQGVGDVYVAFEQIDLFAPVFAFQTDGHGHAHHRQPQRFRHPAQSFRLFNIGRGQLGDIGPLPRPRILPPWQSVWLRPAYILPRTVAGN